LQQGGLTTLHYKAKRSNDEQDDYGIGWNTGYNGRKYYRKGSLCNRNPPKTKTKKKPTNEPIAASAQYAELRRWRFAAKPSALAVIPSAKLAAKVEDSKRFALLPP
jgi:hypothetical protein